MNTGFKGVLLIITFLAIAFPLFTYSKDIIGSQFNSYMLGNNLQLYAYTENQGNKHQLILIVNGLKKEETLYVKNILINNRGITEFNPIALVNGEHASTAFPIKLTPENNKIIITLDNLVSGQIISIMLDTNRGPLYITISI